MMGGQGSGSSTNQGAAFDLAPRDNRKYYTGGPYDGDTFTRHVSNPTSRHDDFKLREKFGSSHFPVENGISADNGPERNRQTRNEEYHFNDGITGPRYSGLVATGLGHPVGSWGPDSESLRARSETNVNDRDQRNFPRETLPPVDNGGSHYSVMRRNDGLVYSNRSDAPPSSTSIRSNGPPTSSSITARAQLAPPKPPHLPPAQQAAAQQNGNTAIGAAQCATSAGDRTVQFTSDTSGRPQFTADAEEKRKSSDHSSDPDERRSSAFELYKKFFESNATAQNNNNNIQKTTPHKRDGKEDETRTVVATAHGVFDSNGGVLESKETGVSIVIPKGAIPENVKQEIYFKVCKDGSILPPLDEKKGETLLSPLVMCGPHGLKFLHPVELRLPHSASVNPESWSFALKSSDSPVGQPSNWQNTSLSGTDSASPQGRVGKNSVSVMVDHF